MSHRSTEVTATPIRRFIAALMLALVILTSFGAGAHADQPDIPAGQGKATLANKQYRTGDLYASIIFSRSDDVQSADGVEIPFSTMMKYPDEGDDAKRYGMLNSPSGESADQAVGGQLVSRFRTMYDYGWFEPLPQSEDNIISRIIQVVIDTASNGVSEKTTRGALSGAIMGASIFDAGANIMHLLNDAVQWLNIPALLGLANKGGDSKGLFAEMFESLANSMGIGANTMKVIQAAALIIIISIATALSMMAFSKRGNRRAHVSNLRTWWSRVLVALCTVSIGTLMVSFTAQINNNMASLDNMPNDLNQSYFVNTLDWATYDNLDMSGINPSGTFNDDGSKSEDFEPSQERIESLKRHIKASKSRYGVTDNLSGNDTSARAMLSNFASGKTVTVKDYFDGIASIPCSSDKPWTGRWDMASSGNGSAVWVCNRQGTEFSFGNFDAGWKNDREFQTEKVTTPFFLSEANTGGSSNDSSLSEVSENATNTTDYSITGKKFHVPNNGKVKVRPINLNSPQSYIYGAIPSENLSESTKSFSNYIYNPDGIGFAENLNPETGEAVKGNDEAARAINTNALAIGIYNRYAGLSATRMSDQSTAFFLQTKRSGPDSINYKGFYTSPNESGEAKNTGSYGNAFVQYVMPTVSEADFYGRVGSLTMVWVLAGILTFATLLVVLRTPILGAIYKSTAGFISAFTTGNLVSFLRYIIYFIAYNLSLIFATFGIYLSVILGKSLIADSAVVQTLLGLKTAQGGILSAAVGWVPFVGDAVEKTNGIAYIIPLVLISSLFALILLWPAFQSPRADGRVRKVSILGAVVSMPYIVADGLDARLTNLSNVLYNKDHGSGNGFVALRNRKNRAEANRINRSKKQEAKAEKNDAMSTSQKVTRKGLGTGVKVAGALAVGAGLTAATGGAGATAAGGLLSKSLGKAGATRAGRVASGAIGNLMHRAGAADYDKRMAGANTLGGRLSSTGQKAFRGAENVLRRFPGGEALIGEQGLWMRSVNALLNSDLRGRMGDVSSVYADRPGTSFSDAATNGDGRDGRGGNADGPGYGTPFNGPDNGPGNDGGPTGGPGQGGTGTATGSTFEDSIRDENGNIPMGTRVPNADVAPGAGGSSAYDLLNPAGANTAAVAANAQVPDGEQSVGARMVGGKWIAADGSTLALPGGVGTEADADLGASPRLRSTNAAMDLADSYSAQGALPVSPSGEVRLPNLSAADLAAHSVPSASQTAEAGAVAAAGVGGLAAGAGLAGARGRDTHTERVTERTSEHTTERAPESVSTQSPSPQPATAHRPTIQQMQDRSATDMLADYMGRSAVSNQQSAQRIEDAVRESGRDRATQTPAQSPAQPSATPAPSQAPRNTSARDAGLISSDGRQMRVDLSNEDIRQMGRSVGSATRDSMRDQAAETMRLIRSGGASPVDRASDAPSSAQSAARREVRTERVERAERAEGAQKRVSYTGSPSETSTPAERPASGAPRRPRVPRPNTGPSTGARGDVNSASGDEK